MYISFRKINFYFQYFADTLSYSHTQYTCSEFLQHGSSSEVNFSANVREEIERDIKKPSRYIFTAAQEQIYQLMQNNIYPRFLNSQEYQTMLKKGKEMQPGGKGFFSKLQYGPRKSQLEANLKDATGISPNLPQRYARKQVHSQYCKVWLISTYFFYFLPVIK